MIGPTIKRIRMAKGLSKSELARRVRVSPTAVHSWEEYGITPRPNLVPVIAAALDTTIAALTGREDAATAAVAHAQVRRERVALIETFKQQIAALYDTTPEKIELLIKF